MPKNDTSMLFHIVMPQPKTSNIDASRMLQRMEKLEICYLLLGIVHKIQIFTIDVNFV